jgi:adenylate kinase
MFTRRKFAAIAFITTLAATGFFQFRKKFEYNKSKYYNRILIIGAPGSGKGTQSELIVKNFGYSHLSSGDIFRSEITAQSPLGKVAQTYIDQGQLVPDTLVISMIQNKLNSIPVESGWLLDGVPRTLNQAKALLNLGCHPDLVIFLNVPDQILLERVCGRREDPVTKKIYHIKYNPAPDEIVDRLTIRSDDTEEKLRARLVNFHLHHQHLIDYYLYNDNECLIIDGNRPANEVYADIHEKLTRQ